LELPPQADIPNHQEKFSTPKKGEEDPPLRETDQTLSALKMRPEDPSSV